MCGVLYNVIHVRNTRQCRYSLFRNLIASFEQTLRASTSHSGTKSVRHQFPYNSSTLKLLKTNFKTRKWDVTLRVTTRWPLGDVTALSRHHISVSIVTTQRAPKVNHTLWLAINWITVTASRYFCCWYCWRHAARISGLKFGVKFDYWHIVISDITCRDFEINTVNA